MSEPTFVWDTDGKQVPAADLDLARRMAEKLFEHYPGWLWMVNAEHHHGIAKIQCGELCAYDQMGYVLKIKDIDARLDVVVRAGGEILERYHQIRGRMPDYVGEAGILRITPDG